MPTASGTSGQFRGRHLDAQASAQINNLLGDASRQRDLLIEHLHKIQDHYHQLSAAHLVALADTMKLSLAEVYEVASFYHHFDIVKENETPIPAVTIRVCNSISCEMAGSEALFSSLQNIFGEQLRIQRVPCVGRCDQAPVALAGSFVVEQASTERVQSAINNDQLIATACNPKIDFKQYQAAQGYRLLADCLAGVRPLESILQTLEKAALRGLGGAGFPAGRKWRILRQQASPRFLVVNIDEGEPGTFKDRHYLEQDPHRFIEGMLIAAWAIEAQAIYLYIRDEYNALRLMLQQQLDLLQTHLALDLPPIHLRRGAGSYICGEESALIESLEGKRGMPRLRPPYVAEVGLFGRPTLEHNMETLFWVRELVEKGADWFTAQGRNARTGLRSFSVSGRVRRPGVHLAPAGISVRQLIDEYCGGMQEDHVFYGYFPGGASGGMLPASLAHIPLDFDTLQTYGCFIGSAAVIVFSTQDSARKLALNAMQFFAHESCGQCTPCRVGCSKAVELMQQDVWDSELLKELSNVMMDASICGLGQAAPNPLLCAMRYFAQEFEA